MGVWALVLLFSVLVEAVVQVFRSWVPKTTEGPGWLWPVTAAALGVSMCVTAGVDALTQLGVEMSVPFIGQALTGVMVSRGASFLHDLWGKINTLPGVWVEDDPPDETEGQ